MDLQILRISSKYQVNRPCHTGWITYWTIQIPHYQMTSELADVRVIIQIALGEGFPCLIIKDDIRFGKALTGQQLSAEKQFCNCCSKI